MNNSTGPETVAAANALSGERTHSTISFPVTGVPDVDVIAGFTVLAQSFLHMPEQARAVQRICEFLVSRYKDAADEQERYRQSWMAGQGAAATSPVTQAPAVAGLPYWTSTGVVDELARQRQAITPAEQADFLRRVEALQCQAKALSNPLP